MATKVYERLIPVFEHALGIYYQSSYYVAKRPIYKAETVFFDRFCYDFVSLFGVNILFLEIRHLELISRKVYSSISYNFDSSCSQGPGLCLIALECVETQFTEEELVTSKNKLHVKS